MTSSEYVSRRKSEHRAWLRDFKRRCERCSEHRSHLLTVLDRATGRGLGMSEGGWSMPISRRDEIVQHAVVLCQRHGNLYRRERHAEVPQEAGHD